MIVGEAMEKISSCTLCFHGDDLFDRKKVIAVTVLPFDLKKKNAGPTTAKHC